MLPWCDYYWILFDSFLKVFYHEIIIHTAVPKSCKICLLFLMVVMYKILYNKIFFVEKVEKSFEHQNIHVLKSNPAGHKIILLNNPFQGINVSYKYQSKVFILLINSIMSSIFPASTKYKIFRQIISKHNKAIFFFQQNSERSCVF